MNINSELTDAAVLTEVGERLKHRRLQTEWTQQALANTAGLGKRTVERLEAGNKTDLISFIRVLRALDLLSNLEGLLPANMSSPMELLELRGQERKRVRRRHSASADAGVAWKWDE